MFPPPIRPFMLAVMAILNIGSSVKACFPLMSPGGCGGGGGVGCCPPAGCPPAVGPEIVPYAAPAYPMNAGAYPPPSPYGGYGGSPVPYEARAKSRSMAMASASSSVAHSADAQCARRYADTRLQCALPFERRTPSDELECQRHCASASPRCRSFQYDPSGSVCDLFEHALGPERVHGAATTTTVDPIWPEGGEQENDAADDGTTTPSNPFGTIDSIDKWHKSKMLLSAKSALGKLRAHQQQQQQQQQQQRSSRRRKRFFLHNGVPMDRQAQQLHGSALRTVGTLPSSSYSSAPSSAGACMPALESWPGTVFVGFDAQCSAPPSTTADPFLLDGTDALSSVEEADGAAAHNSIMQQPLPPPSPPPTLVTRTSTAPTSLNGALEPFTSSSTASQYGSLAYGGARARVESGVADVRELQQYEGAEDCPAEGSGVRARVQLIDGIALQEGGTRAIGRATLQSADVCLHVCRQNALLDGRRLAQPCRAATFSRQSGRCELLADAISPNGQAQYVPNPDSLYFEKVCIPRAELAPGCDDVIHRIPQHHLDPRRVPGGAGGVVSTAQTQLDCVRTCIGAKTKYGFHCVAASFFFDWSTQNCWLARFTRLSRPDLYAAERRELVDYMEMPPCFQLPAHRVGGFRQHDVPTTTTTSSASLPAQQKVAEATEWSHCVGGIRWRRKYNCTGTGCVQKEQCTAEEEGANDVKPIAPSIEVAKRFRAPAVASNEASMFGEQDYEHQKEISFFGPPQQQQQEKNADTEKQQEDNTVTNAQQTTPTEAGGANKKCDPRAQCCALEAGGGGAGVPRGLVRGCSLGTRVMADGRAVSCVPDECT